MSGETYRSAGVDLQAAADLKEKIQAFASITHGPQVLRRSGSFAGLYRLSGYKQPLLAASTDGVGTKLKIATLLGHYESLGIDLVNLNVNDVITCGAKPLFFLDYISMARLDAQVIDALLRGMAWACHETSCALIGGETAQAPGLYAGEGFDLAGTVVGVVEEADLLDISKVEVGDILLGLPSSGLHTNGFSLVRRVFGIDQDPSILYRRYDELGHTLGEELLITHRSYYPMLEPAFPLLKAIAHITGGGLISNAPRVLPDGLAAQFRPSAWETQPIFPLIQREGDVEPLEMYRVFNMGLGMVLVCDHSGVDAVRQVLPDTLIVGEVVEQRDRERVIIQGPQL